MKVTRIRPTVFEVTLHAYELAALMAGARWIAGGATGDLPDDARKQLEAVVDSYDAEMQREPGGNGAVGRDSPTGG